MKRIYTGLESSGKSLLLAQQSIQLARRNKRWHKKYGFLRPIYSNLRFSDKFLEKYAEYIRYFDDVSELLDVQGADIIFDEISTHFSAMKKDPLPRRINQWLRQGAKQGVRFYATAQEFHDIHLDLRRRCFSCDYIKKVLGSPRSGANLPPIRFIWGFCFVWRIKIHPYNELQPEKQSIIPSILFITKSLCNVFDTHQVINTSKELPLDHYERICPVCGKVQISHR